MHIPFFLHDLTSSYEKVKDCSEVLRDALVNEIQNTLENVTAVMMDLCPNYIVNVGQINTPNILTLCRDGYRFHQAAGECMYCGECEHDVPVTAATTASSTEATVTVNPPLTEQETATSTTAEVTTTMSSERTTTHEEIITTKGQSTDVTETPEQTTTVEQTTTQEETTSVNPTSTTTTTTETETTHRGLFTL